MLNKDWKFVSEVYEVETGSAGKVKTINVEWMGKTNQWYEIDCMGAKAPTQDEVFGNDRYEIMLDLLMHRYPEQTRTLKMPEIDEYLIDFIKALQEKFQN